MKRKTTLLAAGLALAGAAHAAEITIYKQPNFTGGDQTFTRDMTSLQGTGVFDQSKSIVVRSGQWQACSQPNFQGDCLVLGRGQYSTLPAQLAGRIESVREVSQIADAEDRYSRWRYERNEWRERPNFVRRDDDRNDRYGRNDRGDRYGGSGYSRRGGSPVVLWADGNATYFDRDMDSLDRTPYGAGAERMVIREGTWEICVQPNFRGMCRTFEPGVYDRLGRFGTQIGSLRRVG
jgi:hypothetical protein